MLPAGIVAKIEKAAMPVPPVFDLIAKTGKIPERDMYNTFNMAPVWFWPLPLRTLPARLQQFPLQASRLM